MVKITLEIPEEAHISLLEKQLERKKKKIEPSAINKIASEILIEALKTEKPAK